MKKNCKHKPKKLSYVQWFTWAEKQIKKGKVQTQCPLCKLWFFPNEF